MITTKTKAKDDEERDEVYDLEAMILILLDIIYDMKREGLDYVEEFEVLLLWDEEFKNNNINNINDEQTEGISQEILSG